MYLFSDTLKIMINIVILKIIINIFECYAFYASSVHTEIYFAKIIIKDN